MQSEADLLDTDLLPIRTAVENPSVLCEAAPTGCPVRHLLCFMHRFPKSSRVEHQQEVSSVSGEVMLSPWGDATSICPITGQPSLAPISVTRITVGSTLRWTFPLAGSDTGLPCSTEMTRSVGTE